MNNVLNKSVPVFSQSVPKGKGMFMIRLLCFVFRARYWWLLFAPFAASMPAQTASFDCEKAKTEVEKAICADAELSRLDEELANAYLRAKEKVGKRIRTEQLQWLRDREFDCDADAVCLRDSYNVRIQRLTLVAGGVPLKSLTSGLVLGRGTKVCDEYEKIIPKVESPVMCARSIPAEYETAGFSQPEWREIDPNNYMELALAIDDSMGPPLNDAHLDARRRSRESREGLVQAFGSLAERYKYNHDKWYLAEADIDNDGAVEQLVKYQRGRCNDGWPDVLRYAVLIMVRSVDGTNIDLGKTRQILRKDANRSFDIDPSSYDVFVFEGKTYVDRWENEGGRNEKSADEKTLTIFLHEGAQSGIVCQFKYPSLAAVKGK